MIVKILTEHHLEFLRLKGGCTASSKSTSVKCQVVGNLMPRLICVPLGFFPMTTKSRNKN